MNSRLKKFESHRIPEEQLKEIKGRDYACVFYTEAYGWLDFVYEGENLLGDYVVVEGSHGPIYCSAVY